MKRWIPNFVCRGCGSVLGKYRYNDETERYDKLCFVCCLGEFELTDLETEGQTYEEIMQLTGREYGPVEKLLPFINLPLSALSCHQTNPRTDIVDISRLTSDIKQVNGINKNTAQSDIPGNLSVRADESGWFSLTSTQMKILSLYNKLRYKKQKKS